MRTCLVLLTLLAGCKGASDVEETPGQPVLDPQSLAPAVGAEIGWVAVYQPLETVLLDRGLQPQVGDPGSLIAGRELAVRVGVTLHDEAVSDKLVVVVQARQGSRSAVNHPVEGLARDPDPDDPTQTFNVVLPPDEVTANLSLEVTVHYRDPVFGAPDPEERWRWRSGPLEPQSTGRLDLVLLPVRVYDGTEQLPDLSEAQLDRYRSALETLYPVEGVDLRVDDPPLAWNEPFNKDTDWNELIDLVAQRRSLSPLVGPKTYYYGLAAPTDRPPGVSGLGQVPEFPGESALRVSVGVGYPGEGSVQTLIHEVGHNHGRYHVGCGEVIGYIDQRYPHDPDTIGVRAWDREADRILNPDDAADFMTYCDPTWISDYNWTGFHKRIVDLEQEFRGVAVPYRRGVVDGGGRGELREVVSIQGPLSGAPHRIQPYDADGRPLPVVDGAYYPYDHLPGGTVLLDGVDDAAVRFELLDPLQAG